jgi:hypothetical protein
MPDPEVMQNDPDLYVMSKAAYDNGWKKITGKSYEEFGCPTSINILWRKPASIVQKFPSENPNHRENNAPDARPEILIRSTLPRISIVTPSFNQGEFLEECIDSILSQRYPNLEYVIMDGGSTDRSFEIIKRYEKYLKHWQSKQDHGQYWAINEGFKHTSGDIMSWINSDDKLFPYTLQMMADTFEKYKNIYWITGICNHIDEKGKNIYTAPEPYIYSRYKYLCKEYNKPFIQQEGTFWKRHIWDISGAYISTEYKYAGDMELWTRFFRNTPLFTVNKKTGSFRKHRKQKTELFFKYYIQEAESIIEKELLLYQSEHIKYTPLPPKIVQI